MAYTWIVITQNGYGICKVMGSLMLMILGDNGSFSSIKIYMMTAICLTYIVCSIVGIVIPMTVSVTFHFGVPKGLLSFLTYSHFLHSYIIGCVQIILQAYIFSLK